MRGFAEFMLRHRRWVVGFWIVAALVGMAAAGGTASRLKVDFGLPGQPGQTAIDRIQAQYGGAKFADPLVPVITVPAGQTVAQQRPAIERTFTALAAELPRARLVSDLSSDRPLVTKDGRTAYAVVFYQRRIAFGAVSPVIALRTRLAQLAPPGTTTGITSYESLSVGSDSKGPGVLFETLIGAVGALAVLTFVFASFLALLPLVVAAMSILLTFVLLYGLTYLMDVSFIVQFLVSLVGLGVAIDYSLLLVTRWREERDHGRDNHDAVVTAVETAGHAVLFSGITVAIGLLALVVLPVPFMRSMGVGGALIPLASVLATLTFTPVFLLKLGPAVDRPRIRRESSASRGWSAWARGVTRHPVLAAGSALVLLGALVVAFFGIKIGQASSQSLATSGPAYEALQVLERGGTGTGLLTPMQVLVRGADADAAAAALGRLPGVAHAIAPADTASRLGDTAVVYAIPTTETVNSSTLGPVHQILDHESQIPGLIGVAGVGPTQIDFLHAVYGNFPLVLTIIGLLTFVLLARAFRSLLLPAKAVVLNLVSLAGVYGAMKLFWQDGHGSSALFGIPRTGAITFWIPLMVFAFLFGLSMDYEVFILSRVREEYDESGSTNEAVVEGIGRTGRLVTSAALILFLAFAALASGPGTDLKTMATALGAGIVIDATIVRSLLVPALVVLFGRANWVLPVWAARLLRVAPSAPAAARPAVEPAPA